ncbi:hypothetical protein [Methanolobus halotolerans]|uniref:Cytidyltransferase-like domain-containing protein n=1 Tax=Methanolobus halotolerans TaxID=2052935 RepID=A0A4E0PV96_9EURY|nr:hypothetical protein [Methanolobus halotolerans]TGC07887.1 hypothetical protein CUN85_10605 [Methanolobus halotolerans]
MDTRIAEELLKVIQQIHASKYRIVLSVTGGGSGAIFELLRHGKGSATLLEALVPYGKNALKYLIGREPDSYCSEETAREMAMASFERALKLCNKEGSTNTGNIIGIGVSCKLLRGEDERYGRKHEVHIASQSFLQTTATCLTLLENRSREEEEDIVSLLIIYRIAQLCKIESNGIRSLLMIPEFGYITNKIAEVSPDIGYLLVNTLLQEEAEKISLGISNLPGNNTSHPGMIFAGSFNPFHKKHAEIARTAFKKCGFPVCLEISLANVDKTPIDFISLKYRLHSLEEYMSEEFMGDVYLTNTPLFEGKATLFLGCCFLIGTDTLNRIFNEKYYREGETKESLLGYFKARKVHFLVFQRKDVDFDIDDDIRSICEVVKLNEYEDDGTSSRHIRKGMHKTRF